MNTLPRKPRAGVFVGVSFAFLGTQEKFKKPLGLDQPAQNGGTETQK